MPKDNTIEKWKEAIESGVRYKEKYGNSKRWKTYRDYGRGIFPGFVGSNPVFNSTPKLSKQLIIGYYRNWQSKAI